MATQLFVFDLNGTLDTLPDPAQYVVDLLATHPDAKVVLYTGCTRRNINTRFPQLCGAVSEVWLKPVNIADKVVGLSLDRLVVVDDEGTIRALVWHSLCESAIPRIEILDPSYLPRLLE